MTQHDNQPTPDKVVEGESPYCRTCDSCGEDGCCSYVNCFRELIKNDKCDYGESYLKDATFSYYVANLGNDVINKLENGLYDAALAVQEYHRQWKAIYDKIYSLTTQKTNNE